jgi:hypothetical protein
VGNVIRGGSAGNNDLVSNLAIAEPARDERRNLLFARRERYDNRVANRTNSCRDGRLSFVFGHAQSSAALHSPSWARYDSIAACDNSMVVRHQVSRATRWRACGPRCSCSAALSDLFTRRMLVASRSAVLLKFSM